MSKITLNAMGEKLTLVTYIYANRRVALHLICTESHEPYAVISVNIIEAELAKNEFCLAAWNLPQQLVNDLLASGLFEDTGRSVATGFVQAPVWRISSPEILEALEDLLQRWGAENESA